MAREEKKEEEKKPQDSIASKVNLDEYAGDEEDHDRASKQADKYRKDLDRPQEPTPPGGNQEG